MHLAPQLVGNRLPCRLADLLQLRAALAQHDRLLAVALDQYLLVDHGRPVLAILPFLGLDRAGIGQLGVKLQVQLLSGNLRRDHPVGRVAQLVRRIMPRPVGHGGGQIGLQIGHPVAVRRRNHEHRLGLQSRRQILRQRQQRVFLGDLDLVEHQYQRLGPPLDPRQRGLDPRPDLGRGIDHQQGPVGILGAFPCRGDHRPVQSPVGLEDAGRVHQYELRFTLDRNPHQPRARGLRLGTDDRDLFADQCIDQRRLARIGRAQDGDQPAFLGHFFIFSNRIAAAAVSASCLLVPSASASPPRATVTLTRKVGAWCAPTRAISS